MKKKFLLIFFVVQISGCNNRTIKTTPDKFISDVIATKELYLRDSIRLVALIKKEINEHKGDYYSKSYDDSTQIIIDTIMYSPNFDKLSFFSIDRKENKKIYPKNYTEKDVNGLIKEGYSKLPYEGYHYVGKVYIGIRKNDSLYINNYFRISTAKYNSMYDARKELRETFFEEYSAVMYKGFEYNLDDKRFWDNPNVWNSIE